MSDEKRFADVCNHMWARSECKPISSVTGFRIDAVSVCPTCLTVTIRNGDKVFHIVDGIRVEDIE